MLEGVLALDRARLGAQHPDVARDLHNLAGVLRIGGELAPALVRYREALAIKLAVLGEGHVDTALTRNSIALVLLAQGELDAAEAELRAAQRVLDAAGHGERAMVTHNLGLIAQRRGRHAEALAAFAVAARLYAETVGADAEPAVRLLLDRAVSEEALGERGEARGHVVAARDRAARMDGAAARAVKEDAAEIVRRHDTALGAAPAGESRPIPAPPADAPDAGTPAQRDVGVYGSAQPWDHQ